MAEADLIGGGGAVHIFNSLNRGSQLSVVCPYNCRKKQIFFTVERYID